MIVAHNGSTSRGGARFVLACLFVAPGLAACGSSKPPASEWPKGNLVLYDQNNYMSMTTLTIPTVETQSGADLTVCWDGISKDILCHDVAATTDIDNVSFLQIPNMSKGDVEQKLAEGTLDENLVKIYRDFHVDHAVSPPTTCTHLSTLALGTVLNPAQDYVEDATKTYMMLFEHGTTPGVGAKTMVFLDPKATASNTAVAAPDGCSTVPKILDFHATLGQPLAVPAADNTKWLVDWSQITHDSFGNPITFTKLDSVLVGFYQDKTIADIQTSFTDIELIATSLYEVPVPAGARDVNLADARLRGGTDPFPGFDRTNGVWMVAVMCSRCQVPAPVALTVLQPQ